MGGFKISDLNTDAQKIIREKNIDKNRDNLINDDNGELATLLSATGKKDIHELAKSDYTDAYILGGELATGLSASIMANKLLEASRKLPSPTEVEDFASKIYGHNMTTVNAYKKYGKFVTKTVPKEMTLNEAKIKALNIFGKAARSNRCWGRFSFGVALASAIAVCYTTLHAKIGKQPINYIEKTTNVTPKRQETTQPTELENTYRNAFTGLGVSEDTELKEYTPQKGEYWISILKAKYGVDDVTAQKMTDTIKKMIYGKSKVKKQPPVMFLPETWTFEGKTYKYNENAKADKTENYSDDVKTEMGKMSKDIKYE